MDTDNPRIGRRLQLYVVVPIVLFSTMLELIRANSTYELNFQRVIDVIFDQDLSLYISGLSFAISAHTLITATRGSGFVLTHRGDGVVHANSFIYLVIGAVVLAFVSQDSGFVLKLSKQAQIESLDVFRMGVGLLCLQLGLRYASALKLERDSSTGASRRSKPSQSNTNSKGKLPQCRRETILPWAQALEDSP